MKKLKSLEEHNRLARDNHHALSNNSPKPNGIACPKCGKELYDMDPMMTLTSDPPQKKTVCMCGYGGYRIA